MSRRGEEKRRKKRREGEGEREEKRNKRVEEKRIISLPGAESNAFRTGSSIIFSSHLGNTVPNPNAASSSCSEEEEEDDEELRLFGSVGGSWRGKLERVARRYARRGSSLSFFTIFAMVYERTRETR